MSDLHIELWPLERLHSYGRQLKDRNTALPKMVEALRTWGFRVPLLVTADGEVVDGEVRLEAARELGLAEAPVIVQDDLTPTQVRTFRLLVNRSATWADWNDEALRAEMAELRLELDNLSLTGFSDRELDAFLATTGSPSRFSTAGSPPASTHGTATASKPPCSSISRGSRSSACRTMSGRWPAAIPFCGSAARTSWWRSWLRPSSARPNPRSPNSIPP